jgi:L-arabinose isomerase
MKIGLVSGGLGAYWPQFPDLLPELQRAAAVVHQRLAAMDAELVDAGFISDAVEAQGAADRLRAADVDLLVISLSTYLTSSMVLPIAQRVGAPALVIDLQPSARMDHPTFDTGRWLAYCGQCSVPEVGNVFRRAGIAFRSVTGHLHSDEAWRRIRVWVDAARATARLRRGRVGLMGHLYPGMLDVSTDLTLISTQLGAHVEVLEFDDLRVRLEAVTDHQIAERIDQIHDTFRLDESAEPDDVRWAATVSVGLDQLVADFRLDAMAYYHRGLGGEIHERLAAGIILGASMLTARGIPFAGEYELRNAVAMLIAESVAGGGSFTEIQALNFEDGVVEMGHDGPAHLALSSDRPLVRGLGTYHGKRGWGVSVEFDVAHGPVTLFGLGQDRHGTLRFITAEGTVVPGPLLQIGNTTSRVDFDCDPGLWVDEWAASGIGHHWSLCRGSRATAFGAVADLVGAPYTHVTIGKN